jgi:hypothetical protein
VEGITSLSRFETAGNNLALLKVHIQTSNFSAIPFQLYEHWKFWLLYLV